MKLAIAGIALACGCLAAPELQAGRGPLACIAPIKAADFRLPIATVASLEFYADEGSPLLSYGNEFSLVRSAVDGDRTKNDYRVGPFDAVRATIVFGADMVAATVLRLISETFCRVGGERYTKENGTFGITTLRKSHVDASGRTALLAYNGKGSIEQRQVVHDPELVRLLQRQLKTPGTALFRYRRDRRWRVITARDVNEYLQRRVGAFSAKDFRTWGGTLRAATVLAELGPAKSATEAKRNVALAMRLVSSELGNTPTICRTSYVHPMVIARYLDEGETIPLSRARRRAANRGRAQSPEERALIDFLDRHFPERRKAPRDAS